MIAIRLLADIGTRVGVLDDAERLLKRCLELDPEFDMARLNYADVLKKREKLEEALEHYGHDPGVPLTVLLKDDTACIRCGLCAVRCPTEAITMERFEFVESMQWTEARTEE